MAWREQKKCEQICWFIRPKCMTNYTFVYDMCHFFCCMAAGVHVLWRLMCAMSIDWTSNCNLRLCVCACQFFLLAFPTLFGSLCNNFTGRCVHWCRICTATHFDRSYVSADCIPLSQLDIVLCFVHFFDIFTCFKLHSRERKKHKKSWKSYCIRTQT